MSDTLNGFGRVAEGAGMEELFARVGGVSAFERSAIRALIEAMPAIAAVADIKKAPPGDARSVFALRAGPLVSAIFGGGSNGEEGKPELAKAILGSDITVTPEMMVMIQLVVLQSLLQSGLKVGDPRLSAATDRQSLAFDQNILGLSR